MSDFEGIKNYKAENFNEENLMDTKLNTKMQEIWKQLSTVTHEKNAYCNV